MTAQLRRCNAELAHPSDEQGSDEQGANHKAHLDVVWSDGEAKPNLICDRRIIRKLARVAWFKLAAAPRKNSKKQAMFWSRAGNDAPRFIAERHLCAHGICPKRSAYGLQDASTWPPVVQISDPAEKRSDKGPKFSSNRRDTSHRTLALVAGHGCGREPLLSAVLKTTGELQRRPSIWSETGAPRRVRVQYRIPTPSTFP